LTYDYHTLTPQERAAVIKARREHGYPLHAPPHPYRGAGWYCITATNYKHQHILSYSARLTAFEDQLLSELNEARVEIGGWVILTNHYHFLIGVQTLDQVSATLQHLHGSTSRLWNKEDGLTGKRKVWYRFRDRGIRGEGQFYQALNYIHYNPVKHGYVDSPDEWPWSSVHLYYDTRGREWLRDRWMEHRIGAGWYYGDEEVSDSSRPVPRLEKR
jgi:putative transposase